MYNYDTFLRSLSITIHRIKHLYTLYSVYKLNSKLNPINYYYSMKECICMISLFWFEGREKEEEKHLFNYFIVKGTYCIRKQRETHSLSSAISIF